MTQVAEKIDQAVENAKGWYSEIVEMLTTFDKAETDEERDNALRTIQESALSVMVRDAWRQPFQSSDDGAEEYEILLSTGGPALRIYGTIGRHDEAETAELQVQDWGTPWTRYPAPQADLLRFVSFFQFG